MPGRDLLSPTPSGFESCELAERSQVVFFAWPARSRICFNPLHPAGAVQCTPSCFGLPFGSPQLFIVQSPSVS